MTGILNYGMGNLVSIKNALSFIEEETLIINRSVDYDKIDRLIIPGVGSFADAMNNICERKLFEATKIYISENKPVLGICLGLQLLCKIGYEDGITNGFSHFNAKVCKFDLQGQLRIPHIGWNGVNVKKEHPILYGVKTSVDFYFLHSYHVISELDVISTTKYGYDFPSILAKKNVIGIQFHPEKSQKQGLRILKNFVDYKC